MHDKFSAKCLSCFHFDTIAKDCDFPKDECFFADSTKFVNGFRVTRCPNHTRCVSFNSEHSVYKLVMSKARGEFQRQIAMEILDKGYITIERYSRFRDSGKKTRWGERSMASAISFLSRMEKALSANHAWTVKRGCVDLNGSYDSFYFDSARYIC